MTVHGAKGLEAPIVFLPDTMQLPNWPTRCCGARRRRCRCGARAADLAAPVLHARARALRERDLQEYRRLLYVALTRAQDRLYVCGWQTRERPRTTPVAYAVPAGRARLRRRSTSIRGADRRARGLVRRGAAHRGAADRPPARERPAAARPAAGRCRTGCIGRRQPSPTRRSRCCRRARAAPSRRRCRRSRRRPRPVQARPARAPAAAEPARTAHRGARGGGAALSGAADARARRRGAGRNRPRDPGGPGRARLRRIVGSGRAGRGAGGRADRRSRPCPARSTGSSSPPSAC